MNAFLAGWRLRRAACWIGALGLAGWAAGAEPATLVDFTRPGHGWRGNPRTRDARQADGFSVALTGAEDPWLEGPAVAVPGYGGAQKLALTLEAECDGPGGFQLFFAAEGQGFDAERMVGLVRQSPVSRRYDGFVPLTAPRMRFRLDPPGAEGRVTLFALRARPLVPRPLPAFARPRPLALPPGALRVEEGSVTVAHAPDRWNALAWYVGGLKVAETNPDDMIAYLEADAVVTVPFGAGAVTAERSPGGFTMRARVRDAGGAEWLLERAVTADRGAVRVETALTVSAAREAAHLPWLTLFAGAGTFGERKTQALLPGVEYLEDEPSSSEKEIVGAAANRRLVDAHKVCYPLMALAAEGRWFALHWDAPDLPVSPLFDTPDRVFGSGGHVMGLWSPAVGDARFEGELTVYGGVRLEAGRTYRCAVTLCGGEGIEVIEAIWDYVGRRGLPPLPAYPPGFDGAVRLLAAGWLDSAGREGLQWRHAVWGRHFPAQPAQDPPAYMLWLAAHTDDVALQARLRETARAVIESLPEGCHATDGISHVRRPVGALVYGNASGLVEGSARRTQALAARLREGRARYVPAAGKPDYASTLGADHCNGFTAMTAEEMLVSASLTGDESAIGAALAVLDRMTANYAGQVPRGAQPWEMPLHTPDIVAAARLVRCYVLGYLLSGREAYLRQARAWAWTGVSMVYLTPPTDGEVGLYATIGVMGATNWRAPNWIGQPVQWCGLVYRSALEDLARVDGLSGGTWRTLARGITLAGLQMTFPLGDEQRRYGLLPDYFLLKAQVRDGPAINPGTLQSHLAEAFGRTPLYTVTRLADGALVHAPGEVNEEPAADGALRLTIRAWPTEAYRVVITRVEAREAPVTWNGARVSPSWLAGARAVVIPLRGQGTLQLAR